MLSKTGAGREPPCCSVSVFAAEFAWVQSISSSSRFLQLLLDPNRFASTSVGLILNMLVVPQHPCACPAGAEGPAGARWGRPSSLVLCPGAECWLGAAAALRNISTAVVGKLTK